MLENVKSHFFKKLIFSFMIEEVKLKIIKYNKNLQKELDISLINYKLYSNKYIIYEENNIAKEYYIYNDKLIFKGEYLNGKRNGKGKEFGEYNRLLFEGEYLNGRRNGNGKEYDNNKIIFEGEYLNGKKWSGKGYNNQGEIKYELKDGKGFVIEGNELFDFFLKENI